MGVKRFFKKVSETLGMTPDAFGSEVAANPFVQKAREYYSALRGEGNTLSASMNASIVRSALSDGRFGYEVLDPSGKRSGEEIETEIEALVKKRALEEARKTYRALRGERNALSASMNASILRRELSDAGVGYEALDPSGRRSSQEMEEEIEKLVKIRALEEARRTYRSIRGEDEYNRLSTSMYASILNRELHDAGVGYDALDPRGLTPASAIEQEIRERVRAEQDAKARKVL